MTEVVHSSLPRWRRLLLTAAEPPWTCAVFHDVLVSSPSLSPSVELRSCQGCQGVGRSGRYRCRWAQSWGN